MRVGTRSKVPFPTKTPAAEASGALPYHRDTVRDLCRHLNRALFNPEKQSVLRP